MKVFIVLALTATFALAQAPAPNGAALFNDLCTGCHSGQIDRAPNRETLRAMPAERILNALERGAMVSITSRRSSDERRALAEFASGKSLAAPSPLTPPKSAMCAANPAFNLTIGPSWLNWGGTPLGTHFQASPALKAADVPKLKVKWAFAFPTDLTAYGALTIANGHLFTGSNSGLVYSLDASTGCVHWYYQAEGSVRGAVTLSETAAFFGDLNANVYGVDVNTGKQLWKTKVDDFPVARITGSPIYYAGRVYVPVGSLEEGPGASPTYECCKFRGSIVALDAFTGKQVWKTYTIDEPARPTTKNKAGTQNYGPSGAPIWSSPIIDTKLNRLYATTGNNYSEPTTRNADAFLAFDLRDGKIVWSRTLTENDAYTAACRMPDKTNCPEVNGPDYDFAASPMLVNLPNGKRALLAGQKSAVMHAVDPDQQGELLWSTKIGKGGTAGGIQWGTATDGTNVYVALSDLGRIMLTYSTNTDADPKVGGGMFAMRVSDGKVVWETKPAPCGTRPRCSPAQSQAVTAMPGVAFSGSVDGHFRAYDARNGKVVWDFDTVREFKAVNGITGQGGSLDGAGPIIVNGMVYVNSGYPTSGGMSGNVLLAFSVDGK
jgi:polyvinyl alcohol dehydrogenase (cytochrome)